MKPQGSATISTVSILLITSLCRVLSFEIEAFGDEKGNEVVGSPASLRARTIPSSPREKTLIRREVVSHDVSAVEIGNAGSMKKAKPAEDYQTESSKKPGVKHHAEAASSENEAETRRHEPDSSEAHIQQLNSTELARLRDIRPHNHSEDESLFEEELFDEGLLDGSMNSGWWDRRRRVDCSWKGWSGWSACKASCGPGQHERKRGRNDARHGGRACSGPSSQSYGCLLRHCPVDCKWTQWTGWTPSACPVSCGTSKQTRHRVKISNQAHGGKECTDPNLNYLEMACGTIPCPIHCEWVPWMPWTPCTASCGGGTMQRVRDRAHTAEHNGQQCGGGNQEGQTCNGHPCPIDCSVSDWQEWGNCTEDCGGGERTRLKNIMIPDQHGGAPCPPTEENGTCNKDSCPIKAGAKNTAVITWLLALLVAVLTLQAADGDLEP